MRESWSEDKVAAGLLAATTGGQMPTTRELRRLPRGNALSGAARRYGPKTMDGWADMLGLSRRDHASRTGWNWEQWFADQAASHGLTVDRSTRVKAPFDMMVGTRRIDVKVAFGAFVANGWQWTWRIGKAAHTCDLYALIAARADAPPRLFIVPAAEVPLTCTTHRRRYAAFQDRWSLI